MRPYHNGLSRDEGRPWYESDALRELGCLAPSALTVLLIVLAVLIVLAALR